MSRINIPDIKKGTYRHNKSGKLYEVIGVALDTETGIPMVIYSPLYEHQFGYEYFTRPYDMFMQVVNLGGEKKLRFEPIN